MAKKTDGFVSAVTSFFNEITLHFRIFLATGVGIFCLALFVVYALNHKEAKGKAARNELFSAQKLMDQEFEALVEKEKAKQPPAKAGEKKADKNAEQNLGFSVAFEKLDVDSQFPGTVKKLQEVEKEFDGTRSAFEARQDLADLYFSHKSYDKALVWFQKAVDTAPGHFEKALALSALGYTYENLGKPEEALRAFQSAVNLGEGTLKGDLLLGVARCYEAIHDLAKARSTYDQILADLPNTDYAKTAEVLKSQLHG